MASSMWSQAAPVMVILENSSSGFCCREADKESIHPALLEMKRVYVPAGSADLLSDVTPSFQRKLSPEVVPESVIDPLVSPKHVGCVMLFKAMLFQRVSAVIVTVESMVQPSESVTAMVYDPAVNVLKLKLLVAVPLRVTDNGACPPVNAKLSEASPT